MQDLCARKAPEGFNHRRHDWKIQMIFDDATTEVDWRERCTWHYVRRVSLSWKLFSRSRPAKRVRTAAARSEGRRRFALSPSRGTLTGTPAMRMPAMRTTMRTSSWWSEKWRHWRRCVQTSPEWWGVVLTRCHRPVVVTWIRRHTFRQLSDDVNAASRTNLSLGDLSV